MNDRSSHSPGSQPAQRKPLTFAAMLVRAQRRFEALGRPFPSMLLGQARAVLPAGKADAGPRAQRLAPA